MKRRLTLLAVVALVGAGCSNQSPGSLGPETVAVYRDAVYTNADLVSDLQEFTPDTELESVDDVPLSDARILIGNWVNLQVLEPYLTDDLYTEGLQSAGYTCFSVLPQLDLETAQATKAALDAGRDWADAVTAVQSITPGFIDGDQGCHGIGPLTQAGVAEIIGPLTAATPYSVLEDPQGVFLLRHNPAAETSPTERAQGFLQNDPGVLATVLGDEVFADVIENIVRPSEVCISHILVGESQVGVVNDLLASGVDFAEVARMVNSDTSAPSVVDFAAILRMVSGDTSAPSGSALGCFSDADLDNFVPEFAAAVATADPGVVTAPVTSEFGTHFILTFPGDQATDNQITASLAAATPLDILSALTDTDSLVIDPLYGYFNPNEGVVALG